MFQLPQNLVVRLEEFWVRRGYRPVSPIDTEVGAGTSHWHTFLRSADDSECNVTYTQPSRRPKDGRYAKRQDRLYRHTQYQVIMRPIPDNLLFTYFESLKAAGLNLRRADFRLVEDCWANPTLGAHGIGWEVLVGGQEVTQITFFQRMGGLVCCPRLGEITYGLERIGSHLPKQHSSRSTGLADLEKVSERENSLYSLNYTNNSFLRLVFKLLKSEVSNLVSAGFVVPSFELLLKMCHTFNLLVARAKFTHTERVLYCSTIRSQANQIAKLHRTRMRNQSG